MYMSGYDCKHYLYTLLYIVEYAYQIVVFHKQI